MDPVSPERQRKRLWGVALGAATLFVTCGLSMLGLAPGVAPGIGAVSLVYTLMISGGLAAAYFGAGIGFGLLLMRVLLGPRLVGAIEKSDDRVWLAVAVGPAALLWFSHLIGVLGLLSGPKGFYVGWGVCALGLSVLIARTLGALAKSPNLPAFPASGGLWVLPVALMLVAASNPPGALWSSEARGFDAMSYHLQLPQEWARGSRIEPLQHNFYSYLPSYFEAAFTQLSAMTGGGSPRGGGVAIGLVAGDGAGAMACQLLHAMMGFAAALLIARFVWRTITDRFGESVSSRLAVEAAGIAGAAAVATPWVLVVSSLAYNESAVNALFAGAILAAVAPGIRAWPRGLLCGLLVGVATGCKPTAAFFVAPTVGMLLLWTSIARGDDDATKVARAKPIAGAVLACTVAGLISIAPFLIRNYAYGGNPVFPAAASLFGRAHWTTQPDQIARFTSAHSETASLADKLGLLVARSGDGLPVAETGRTDPTTGRRVVLGQPRGLMHEQWSLMVAAGFVGLVLSFSHARVRSFGAALMAGVLLSLAWWLLFSHCQSRFLVPLVVPLAIGIGLGAGRIAALGAAGAPAALVRLGLILFGAGALLMSGHGARLFLQQNVIALETGSMPLPNLFLPDGTSTRTGTRISEEWLRGDADERKTLMESVSPEAVVSFIVGRGLGLGTKGKVFLLGDSTPFYFSCDTLYHTTYDQSPLGAAIRKYPDDHQAWTAELDRVGVTHVLVNSSELSRLSATGWYDPGVTPEAVNAWLQEWGEPLQAWNNGGLVLYRLRKQPFVLGPTAETTQLARGATE